MPKEPCLESIHVHTGETLKRDLQDLARVEGRPIGEYLRDLLERHVGGAKAKLLSSPPTDQGR